MAELVDAHGSGPCAERCGGSSPLPGTNINEIHCTCGGFFSSEIVQPGFKPSVLERLRHQIMTLRAHNTHLGELADLQSLADFLGRQQLDYAVDLGRISVAATNAAFFAQDRGKNHQ